MIDTASWMNVKIIMLSEKPDQTEKPYIVWFHFISLENVNCSDRKQISGCLGMGLEGEGGMNYKGARGNSGGDGYVYHFEVMVSWVYTCVKPHQVVHQIVCQLCLNRAVKNVKKWKFKCSGYVGKAEGHTGEEHFFFPVIYILFHYGLSQDIEYSSLYSIIGPCWV